MKKLAPMLFLFSCALSPAAAQKFENVTASLQLEGVSKTAASWGDFDNDGWVDLFSAGIFRNESGGRFKKVAAGPPHTSVADYNGDGFLDAAGVGEAHQQVTLSSYNGKTHKWDDQSPKFAKVPTYRPYLPCKPIYQIYLLKYSELLRQYLLSVI